MIDSVESFSPHLLLSMLVAGLQDASTDSAFQEFTHEGGFVYSKNTRPRTEDDDASTKKQAAKLLDKVAILRVFDFEGLMEAVGEVGDTLSTSPTTILARSDQTTQNQRQANVDSTNNNAGKGPQIAEAPQPSGTEDQVGLGGKRPSEGLPAVEKAEILDSDDDLAMDEDLAFEQSSPLRSPSRLAGAERSQHTNVEIQQNYYTTFNESSQTTLDAQFAAQRQDEQSHPGNPALILIPSIHSAFAPLLKQNYVRSHALLVHLIRRLRLLAHAHNATIVLGNSTVSPRPELAKRPDDEAPSAFEDIVCRPALGKTFNWGLDLSLMLSRLPTSKSAVIAECLHDRNGGRAGRWVALEIGTVDTDGIAEIRRVSQ